MAIARDDDVARPQGPLAIGVSALEERLDDDDADALLVVRHLDELDPEPTLALQHYALVERLRPGLVEEASRRNRFLADLLAMRSRVLDQARAQPDGELLVALLGRETLKAKQLAPPLQLVLQLMTLLRKAQPPAAAALAAAVAPALPPLAARHANARSAVTLVRRTIAATSPAGGGGGGDAPAPNGHGGSGKKAKKAKKERPE